MPNSLEDEVKRVSLRFNTEDAPRGVALNIPHFFNIVPYDPDHSRLSESGRLKLIFHNENNSKVSSSTLVPPSFFEMKTDFWTYNSLPYELDTSLQTASSLQIGYALFCELMMWEQWMTKVYETSLKNPYGISGIQERGDKCYTIIHVSGVHNSLRIQGLYNLPYNPITRRAKEFLRQYLYGNNDNPELMDRGKNLLKSISSRHQLAFRLGVIPYADLLQKMVTKEFIENLAEGDYVASNLAKSAKADIEAFFDSKNWSRGENPGFSVANTSEIISEDGSSQVYKIRLYLPGNNNIDIAAKLIEPNSFSVEAFNKEVLSLERLMKLQGLPTGFYHSSIKSRLIMTRFLNGDRMDMRQLFFGNNDLQKVNSRLADLHIKGYELKGKVLDGAADPWGEEKSYLSEFLSKIIEPLGNFIPVQNVDIVKKGYTSLIAEKLDQEMEKGKWVSLVHGDLHNRQIIHTPYGAFLVDADPGFMHYGLAQVDKKRINSYSNLSIEDERLDAKDYIEKRFELLGKKQDISNELIDEFLEVGDYAHLRNEIMIAYSWALKVAQNKNSDLGYISKASDIAMRHLNNASNYITTNFASRNNTNEWFELRDIMESTIKYLVGYQELALTAIPLTEKVSN